MVTIDLVLTNVHNEKIQAQARPFDPIQDVLSYYIDWFPLMYNLAGQPLYQDSHWKITKYWEGIHGLTNFDIIIIEAQNRIQGYVTIKLDHIDIYKQKSVYIPFVATAPWNRNLTEKETREFTDIGKILLALAGLNGYKNQRAKSIELHSLSHAENFYKRLGMVETGNLKGRMKEFHLNESGLANLILSSKRYIKLKALD